MTLKTRPFDVAEYLKTDEDIHLFLQAAFEEGNEEEFVHALATYRAMTKRGNKLKRQNELVFSNQQISCARRKDFLLLHDNPAEKRKAPFRSKQN